MLFKKNKGRLSAVKSRRNSVSLNSTRTGNDAPVVRYYRPESVQKKSNIRLKDESEVNKKKFNLFQFLYKWIGILAILFLVIANTTLSGVVIKIQNFNETTPYKSNKQYKDKITDIFNKNMLNKNKISFNSTKFETQIKNEFPEVESVVAVIPLAGRGLQVGLTLTEPLARLQTNGNKQTFLGQNGKSIEYINDSDKLNEFNLPILSIPNISFNVGDQLLTNEEVKLIDLLTKEFDGSDSYRYSLKSIEFNIKSREIMIRFNGVNFYAKLTVERQIREQVGSLVATIKNLSEQGNLPKEYIDVRVEDRVFVK